MVVVAGAKGPRRRLGRGGCGMSYYKAPRSWRLRDGVVIGQSGCGCAGGGGGGARVRCECGGAVQGGGDGEGRVLAHPG